MDEISIHAIDSLLERTEAERAIIGSILQRQEVGMTIAIKAGCSTEWFSCPNAKNVWSIMCELHDEKAPIDLLSVSNKAKMKKLGEAISMYCTQCYEDCVSPSHIEYFLDVLKDSHMKRRMLMTLYSTMSELPNEGTMEDIVSKLRNEIDSINIFHEQNDDDIRTKIEKRCAQGEESGFVGIPSRWDSLQRKLGGYKKGKVALWAARPSIGKTTSALNEARFQAQHGYNIGIISLETEETEIYETMAGDLASVDLFKMLDGTMTPQEKTRLMKAVDTVINLPITVAARNMDIRQICNWISYNKARKNLDVVIIDYIQIISDCAGLKLGSMRDKVSYYSKKIAESAKINDVAIILLAQISRHGEPPQNIKPEERWNYVPRLHHLKESGALEEDAYQAILLYNDPTEGDTSEYTTIPLIMDVAKNKRGPRGKVHMIYKKNMQRIEGSGSISSKQEIF